MATVGALLGAFGTLLLLVVVVMFLPTPALRTKRRLASRLTLGGLVLFITGLVLTPTPPPSAHNANEQTATKTARKTTVTPASKSGPSKNTKDEFVGIFAKLLSSAKPCDAAVDDFAKVAQTGNVYIAYRAARTGSNACEAAVDAIESFTVPQGLDSETSAKVEEALATCRTSYGYRRTAFEKAMQFTDGDGRASVVNAFADDLLTAKAGIILCVARFYGVAGKMGINPDRMAKVAE